MMRFAVLLTLTLVFLLDNTLFVQAGRPRGAPMNGNKKRRQMRMQKLRGLQTQQQEPQGASGAVLTSIVIITPAGESTSPLDPPAATTTTTTASTTTASTRKGGMTSGGMTGGMTGGTTGARAEGTLEAPPVCLPNETLLFLNEASTFFCATPQRTEGPTGMESRLHVFGPDGREIFPTEPVTVTEAKTVQSRTFCPDDQTMIFLQEGGKHVCVNATVTEEVVEMEEKEKEKEKEEEQAEQDDFP